MGDGHLVYNNEISYLIGTVNTRESGAGKGNVQIELQSRSPVLTRHCAFQEPRGVWCGWSTEWGGERSALSWGYRDRQEPGQTEPFIFSMPSTILEIISSGFTFRLQASYLFILELWAWHAPHLGQLFFPHYWLLIHSSVPSSGPSSTTKKKNSKPNHQYGAPNGIDIFTENAAWMWIDIKVNGRKLPLWTFHHKCKTQATSLVSVYMLT